MWSESLLSFVEIYRAHVSSHDQGTCELELVDGENKIWISILFLVHYTETRAIRRIPLFLVWMLSFSILAFECLSVRGSWLFGWCQLLSVYSVKMVFVLTAKENMVTQCGGKWFDENHLMNIVHVPFVLEFHFRWNACWRNNQFQTNLSYTPVFLNIHLCA